MARTERTAAVVLRSVAYGESDRILTLLTEAHGKLAVMARGARKSTRRFGGALEPYALIEADCALGRGDLGRLAEARLVRAFPGVLADLTRMSVAAAGLELVREVLPDRETPDPRLLPTVIRFFELSERLGTDALRFAFALRVLNIAGLSPNLASCGRCGVEAPEGRAALFDPGLGAIVCRSCGGGPFKIGGRLRTSLAHASTGRWEHVAGEDWLETDRAAAQRVLDAFLERHLGRRLAGGDVLSQVREVRRSYDRSVEE
ncbi:MAG: DNA repair protein RecO [Sandaracinaceae bacterium]